MKDLNPSSRPSRRRLLLLLATCPIAAAQQLRGRWSATAGGRTLSGTWTAQPHEETDAAFGTWTLLDRSGKRMVYGTWSARKAKDTWEGRWLAEVDRGRKYEGSWMARLGKPGSLPLIDLFRSASDRIVSGTWRSDSGLSGAWSIQADR
jgi:hypothetical protein